jgi:hypothetical protein
MHRNAVCLDPRVLEWFSGHDHSYCVYLSAHGDSQRLESAQNIVQDRFFLKDCEAPDAFGQCVEQCQHFDACEIHPDAGVRAGAEPEMIARSPGYALPAGARGGWRRAVGRGGHQGAVDALPDTAAWKK